jgi:hypothetical protein
MTVQIVWVLKPRFTERFWRQSPCQPEESGDASRRIKMTLTGKCKSALVLVSAVIIAACGGSNSDTAGTSASPDRFSPTVWTSDNRPTNSCSYDPACSGNPYAPFTVFVSPQSAGYPADGATLSGFVRLQVRGLALANVELLPASGYTPQLGIFQLASDKTHAWLDLDTTRLPNGPLSVRVSAFNVPAGQPGAVEMTAMSPRVWNINNPVPPAPAASLSVASASAPADGSIVSGTTRLEVRGTGIANAELLPGTGYTPRLGQFNVAADRTYAWLDLDTRTLPDGVRDVRVSVFNVTPGQPNAQEVIAMPARRWDFRNGTTAAFNGTATVAPLHGEIVSGTVVLEVRGAGLRNIELLPPAGYTPIHGRFIADVPYSFGYLEFDTRTLPNGPVDVRISAFNTPAGQPGAQELIVMPPRQWIVQN